MPANPHTSQPAGRFTLSLNLFLESSHQSSTPSQICGMKGCSASTGRRITTTCTGGGRGGGGSGAPVAGTATGRQAQ